MSAFDAKIGCDGDRDYVSTPDRKKNSLIRGAIAVERKASKIKMKSKKAIGRMAESATHRTVAATDGDVVATATARAKKVFPMKLRPPIRRHVLNTIVSDFFKSILGPKDRKVVDDILNDLPRVTRSEPTAAILPKLEDQWM